MSAWTVAFVKEAEDDMEALDGSQRAIVLKAIQKTAQNPLPNTEGGYGKPLGNRQGGNLSGYLKIKIKSSGLRVVYRLVRDGNIMRIVVVSIRDDATVYKLAAKRIK